MIAFTPGEPAGIGPDLAVQYAQQARNFDLVAFADPALLQSRADLLNLPIQTAFWQIGEPIAREAGKLSVYPIPLDGEAVAGRLNPTSASYVLETIRTATNLCLDQNSPFSALVTGPIHKGIINQAGELGLLCKTCQSGSVQQIPFTGHTEFLQALCGVDEVVMMLANETLRVALVTTHLPLSEVAAAITKEKVRDTATILHNSLRDQFHIAQPKILVAGLNPHAGEDGHLGCEEIEIITPVLDELRSAGMDLIGPLPADTLFTERMLETADAVLAMYHDQGLPVLKHSGFGRSVNVTLGLPFLRTSVDHGTALELAGTGKADLGSLQVAMELAKQG